MSAGPTLGARSLRTAVVRKLVPKQAGGITLYAFAVALLEPSRDSGVDVDDGTGGLLDDGLLAAWTDGVRGEGEAHGLAVRATLVDARAHPIDSRPVVFRKAGRLLVRRAIESVGTGPRASAPPWSPLEPAARAVAVLDAHRAGLAQLLAVCGDRLGEQGFTRDGQVYVRPRGDLVDALSLEVHEDTGLLARAAVLSPEVGRLLLGSSDLTSMVLSHRAPLVRSTLGTWFPELDRPPTETFGGMREALAHAEALFARIPSLRAYLDDDTEPARRAAALAALGRPQEALRALEWAQITRPDDAVLTALRERIVAR